MDMCRPRQVLTRAVVSVRARFLPRVKNVLLGLSNFRAVAEGAGLRWDGTESLPLQVGYDAQVVVLMRVRT